MSTSYLRHQIYIKGSQKGFTIIELMIATSVFATVLMVVSVGLLQVGRTYYKGVTTSRTQEAARTIMNEITGAIQFGGGALVGPLGAPTPNDGSRGFCVGGKRFSYILGRQLVDSAPAGDQSRHVLVLDDNAGTGACAPGTDAQPVTLNPSGRELLSTRMRLANLGVTQISGTDLYRVVVRVVSGDMDVLNAARDGCAAGRSGTQFCAVSELSTVVQKRVR